MSGNSSVKNSSLEFLSYHCQEETEFRYNKELISAAGRNCYLDGYWQSWRYFADIEPLIRKKFRIREEHVSPLNLRLGESIEREDSVSIHIRRTDYLHPRNSHMGALPVSYYDNAVARVLERVSSPRFYIFSDDPDWAAANIVTPSAACVIRGTTDIEDLYLMSRCRHNIIANSTFSWWGAWLGAFPGKTVVAPRKWFPGSNLDIADTDLIPPDWIAVEV